MVCDFFAPSNIHCLYCHAVSPNGYQSCKDIKSMNYIARGDGKLISMYTPNDAEIKF